MAQTGSYFFDGLRRLRLVGSFTVFWLATVWETIFLQAGQSATWVSIDSRLREESEPLTKAAISWSLRCPDFSSRARLCATPASRYGQQT